MSLQNFLSTLKSKKIERDLKFIDGYKRVHKCTLKFLFHDNGIIVLDAQKGICIIDLIVA
jgi:hypothetical protein